MEENFRRYPIGIQNFEDLRNNDCVYVDKTELIYSKSSPTLWEKFAGFYTRSLFPGKKRTVSRLGYGDSGKGLDGLPGTTL